MPMQLTNVLEKLHYPTSWICSQSHTTDDIWICLGDGVVCAKGSSDTGGPASDHFNSTGLALFLRLTETDNHRQLTIEEECQMICYSQVDHQYFTPETGSPEKTK